MLVRPGGATVAAAALALILALAAAALAWSQPRLGENRPLGIAATADGALRISDSRGERAVLEATGLPPGGAAVGSVRVENQGAPASLVLSRRQLAERLGAGGASLAGALRMRIRDVTTGAGRPVYSGNLTAMPNLNLGILPTGAERRYRFVARLPDPGFVDNGLMGARVRFDFRWQLRRQ